MKQQVESVQVEMYFRCQEAVRESKDNGWITTFIYKYQASIILFERCQPVV